MTRRECPDPTADMKRMHDTLATQGMSFQSRSVLTTESEGAYTMDVTTTGSTPSKERLVAKRVGECQP